MLKGLVILQGGKETVVPDTSATRRFWENYNSIIGRSKIAHKKYVVILEATSDQVKAALLPQKSTLPVNNSAIPTFAPNTELELLRGEIAALKALVAQTTTLNAVVGQPVASERPSDPLEDFHKFD